MQWTMPYIFTTEHQVLNLVTERLHMNWHLVLCHQLSTYTHSTPRQWSHSQRTRSRSWYGRVKSRRLASSRGVPGRLIGYQHPLTRVPAVFTDRGFVIHNRSVTYQEGDVREPLIQLGPEGPVRDKTPSYFEAIITGSSQSKAPELVENSTRLRSFLRSHF